MDPQQTTSAGGVDNGLLKDPTTIVKGKRTKRQRLQSSSIPFAIVSHSSTSYNAFNSSPASSSEFPAGSTTTEDEDTAKCLILLSKGHNVSRRNNNDEFSGYKFNSKKYIQTSTDAHGFTGMYVYECKTCSRTFPSFQALGGHRASHKKPRINELDQRKLSPYTAFSDEDEPLLQFPSRKNNSSSSSSISLQLNHRVSSPGNSKKSSTKLHECSICGTEFNSGQALGGHMRRHRVTNGTSTTATAVTATNTTLSLIPYSPVTTMVADDRDYQKSRDGLCLDLDLNLPAPPETAAAAANQDHSFKIRADQNKQQPVVHLSATPTLVDCHY
ncbi:hypothetical protein L1887_09804 [Cichorium endivia]|nr:hypothetical protein L1887_09804 [Cichorium endivia]